MPFQTFKNAIFENLWISDSNVFDPYRLWFWAVVQSAGLILEGKSQWCGHWLGLASQTLDTLWFGFVLYLFSVDVFSSLIFISSDDDVDSSLMFLRWRCWWSIAMVDRGCVAWSLVDGPEVGAGDNFSSLCTSSNNMGATPQTWEHLLPTWGHLHQYQGTSTNMGTPTTTNESSQPLPKPLQPLQVLQHWTQPPVSYNMGYQLSCSGHLCGLVLLQPNLPPWNCHVNLWIIITIDQALVGMTNYNYDLDVPISGVEILETEI